MGEGKGGVRRREEEEEEEEEEEGKEEKDKKEEENGDEEGKVGGRSRKESHKAVCLRNRSREAVGHKRTDIAQRTFVNTGRRVYSCWQGYLAL